MPLTPTARQLERLGGIKPGKHPIVSCYIKLEPRDRARGKYLIKLKNRVREVQQGLPRLELGKPEGDAVLHDLERIQQALQAPEVLPATQGLAVFASTGHGLFEVLPLPKVYRSRLAVDRTPLVRELILTQDEVGRLLTVVVDRSSAAIYEVTAFGARKVEDVTTSSTRTGRSRSRNGMHGSGDRAVHGMGDYTYQNRIRQDKQRHLEGVAQRLFTIDRAQPAHGIVLAGTGPEAKALEPFLHPYLRDRLIGSTRLNAKETSTADIHTATLQVREAYERASERELVREMSDGLGTGWAVNGVRRTLRALGNGQVRTLLVSAEQAMPGYRCADGQLVLTRADGKGRGPLVPVLDVIDDAIEEGLRQRVRIDVIFEPTAQSAVDGLAGILRFR